MSENEKDNGKPIMLGFIKVYHSKRVAKYNNVTKAW